MMSQMCPGLQQENSRTKDGFCDALDDVTPYF